MLYCQRIFLSSLLPIRMLIQLCWVINHWKETMKRIAHICCGAKANSSFFCECFSSSWGMLRCKCVCRVFTYLKFLNLRYSLSCLASGPCRDLTAGTYRMHLVPWGLVFSSEHSQRSVCRHFVCGCKWPLSSYGQGSPVRRKCCFEITYQHTSYMGNKII